VSDTTSNSATLNGKVGNYISLSLLTAWFQYGIEPGNYSGTSTTQIIRESGVTEVSIGIRDLSPATTYYYRIVAQGSDNVEYRGNTKSFTTLSATETPAVSPTPTPFLTSNCHSVSGMVTDAVTGKGIENATILGGMGISYTDTHGLYSWHDPEELLCCGGTYTITASADGYLSQSQSIEVEPNIEGTLNFELQQITTPTPTSTVTPVPECETGSIAVFPKKMVLKRGKSGEVTVTLKGKNGCSTEGKIVEAAVSKTGIKRISITPESQETDENGEAKFIITARNKAGNAKVTFREGILKKSFIVKVTAVM
jgi:hypothetical protein